MSRIWRSTHGDQSLATDIAKVRQHKADLVDREIAVLCTTLESGAEFPCDRANAEARKMVP